MAYDTTEAVAKFLSGFQMKITNRERDTVAPEKDDRDAQPPVDTDNPRFLLKGDSMEPKPKERI